VDVVLWKWIVSIVFTLIAGLTLTAYGILSRCDVNRFKPLIIEQVKNATGRDLKLGGEIDLDIGLRPVLGVEGVVFQNAPWAFYPQMVRIKRFEMQVGLIPLLFGEIELKRLMVIGPEVFIESHPSSKPNTHPGMGKKDPEAAATEGLGNWLSLFFFKDLQVKDGRLIYRDHQSGRSHSLVIQSFRARAAKPQTLVEVSLKGAYEKREFVVEGTIGPLAALFSADKTWPLKVKGRLAGNAFSVVGAVRDVLEGKGLRMFLKLEGGSLQKASRLASISGIPELGSFRVSGEISNLEGPLRLRNIEARIGTERLVKLQFTGAIRDPMRRRGIDLRFSAQGKDVAKLKRMIKTFPPLRGPFEVSGRAIVSAPQKYTFRDLKVSHDQLDFEGSVDIDVSRKTPNIKAILTSKKIDLRPFLPPKKAGGAVQSKTNRVFPRDPLPFHLLRKANGQFRLCAEKALLPRVALKALDLDLVIEDGCLTARELKCRAGGGTICGFFDLLPQGKTAKMDMQMTLRHVDVGRMLRQLKARRVLEGDLDADLDLQGSGRSMAELMAGLNGKTCVAVGAGRIHKEYVRFLETDLGAGVSRLFSSDEENTNYREFNCFVNGFHIQDGLAEVTALVLDTEHTSVIGEGRINLRTEQLDLSLKPFPKKGIETGLFGKLNLSFGALAKPLKLEGTMAEPTCRLDPGQTAIIFGKAVGGVALFGPLGIAVALASCSPEDRNPCLSAIEAAKKGVKISESKARGSRKEGR
jgi:uncharacterized protein involved in outer membrane biogenesis